MKQKQIQKKQRDQNIQEKDAESTSSISNNVEDVCSRLIAKNLPGTGKKKWDESRIRNYFGKFGKITDVKLKLNEKTCACKFAFIGFEDPKSCQMAIKKLNGSFLHGTKLQIEECKPLTDERKDITNKFTLQKLKQKVNSQQCLFDENDNLNVNELQEKMILDTGRLFVRNLPFSCSESNLNELFSPFGPIAELECIINQAGECKGFALCTFMFPEHALEAWKKLDGKIFMGRMLHIIAGKEKKKSNINQQEGKALSNFQRDRSANRKKNAGKTIHTWNALFLGSNAVAETLAETYEVEKRHLLLDEGENSAAVRMAMAETNLVRETRKFLIENGIKLDAFSKANAARSKTVILVKHLSGRPGEQAQLRRLFSQYGDLKSIIMPPVHGISALVEMGNELNAKKAFEGLAYAKKLQNEQPIYLEWAPMDVFDENRSNKTLKTTENEGKNDEIVQKESANNEDKKEEKQPEITKILVRNVPFQANIKEISQLFSAFGELKFIRLPKKVGGEGHRGFCFVDFISIGDAKRAMDSLVYSTHLYGRRLVLEWAKQEETIDELRNKTKRKMHPGKESKNRTKMRSFAPPD